jgi:hypothetical protein
MRLVVNPMASNSMTQPNMGYKNPGATPNLRGVERNTARGVMEPVKILNVIEVEYAPANNQTQVVPYRTWDC